MLLYYFSELKNRIILLILCWLSSFCTCYSYKEILLFLFIKPSLNLTSKFNKIYFISTNITEIFNTYINLAIFISNQIVFVLLIIVFVLLVDQISKFYVKTHFSLGDSVKVFDWFQIFNLDEINPFS